jgi:pyruvate dehydrogenase E1 component alpha subunit
MDVLACHQAAKFSKQWAVDDKGPLLAEYVTYRYGGHSCVSPFSCLFIIASTFP